MQHLWSLIICKLSLLPEGKICNKINSVYVNNSAVHNYQRSMHNIIQHTVYPTKVQLFRLFLTGQRTIYAQIFFSYFTVESQFLDPPSETELEPQRETKIVSRNWDLQPRTSRIRIIQGKILLKYWTTERNNRWSVLEKSVGSRCIYIQIFYYDIRVRHIRVRAISILHFLLWSKI